MGSRDDLRRLRCPACGWQKLCGPEDMLARLRALGMLRREAQPPLAMVLELLQAQLSRLRCDACSAAGLVCLDVADDFDDWGTGRLCASCGRPLPAERLELLPDAQRCAACEQTHQVTADAEFCPRCGGQLQVKSGRGPGVARYRLVCGDCGYSEH